MPSLIEQLKSLGVQLGTSGVKPKSHVTTNNDEDIKLLDDLIHGTLKNTPLGNIYVIDSTFENDYLHGENALISEPKLTGIAKYLKDESISNLDLEKIVFLDTETTGLSSGTGTFVFLIGIGKFVNNKFHLTQLFMQNPAQESAQLAFLENYLATSKSIVTFNGKSFDIPLLCTRYTYNQWVAPFGDEIHIDLLHISRKLWRNRLSTCALGNIEFNILGFERSSDDIPGWQIPQIYNDYLASGDPRMIQRVIYHNAMDIVSLAALFIHICTILGDPENVEVEKFNEIIPIGRIFEESRDLETAKKLYWKGIHLYQKDINQIPTAEYIDATWRLASIYKRNDEIQSAINLWEDSSKLGHIPSFVELAKIYEHKQRDYAKALHEIDNAIDLIDSLIQREGNKFANSQWRRELSYRKARILRKISSTQ